MLQYLRKTFCLGDADQIFVMDTWGTNLDSSARFSQDGLSFSRAASGATVSWGRVALTAAGGQYRLCWGPGSSNASYFNCNKAEFVRVDIGELTIIGPGPPAQHRTCIAGQLCLLHGITGQQLSVNNAFWY